MKAKLRNPDLARTQFKPGQSGNPNGRPRKIPALDLLLAEVLGYEEGKPQESALAKQIILALFKKAKRGNVRAANVLLERAFGKVKQVHEIGGVSKTDVEGLFPFTKVEKSK
jgi:hypothetical protein